MIEQLKQMVAALCGKDPDPRLREAAILIAENEFWLCAVKAEKVATIERLRDPMEHSFSPKTRLERDLARFREYDLEDQLFEMTRKIYEEAIANGRDPESVPLPRALQAALQPEEKTERDVLDALRAGLWDLKRLLRYEQQAWSRRKKALYAFMAVKVSQQYNGS
jgi:hypothetical protein